MKANPAGMAAILRRSGEHVKAIKEEEARN